MERLPRHDFKRCVARYSGEKYVKRLSCREQFFAMAFGQLAYRESLRDIVTCLSSHSRKLYHLGFRHRISLSALARANEKRNWRIWRDLALTLILEARSLYIDEPAIAADIEGACYAIDSTSIELCLSLFPSFPYVSTAGAVKLHLGLDIRGSIPAFFDMTSGKANSDCISHRRGYAALIPRHAAAYQVSCARWPRVCFSHQQPLCVCVLNRTPLQESLAD